MGFSIFYSLSLPKELNPGEAKAKLSALAAEARRLAKGTDHRIGKIRTLTDRDCAKAQAKMNRDFSFARSACMPPGGRRRSPLGEVPAIAMYFRLGSAIDIGIARYAADAPIRIPGADGQYDGRWFFWTYVGVYPMAEAGLLRAVLLSAEPLGFSTTYRNEADRSSAYP